MGNFCQSDCRAGEGHKLDVTNSGKIILENPEGEQKILTETPDFFETPIRSFDIWIESDYVHQDSYCQVDPIKYPQIHLHHCHIINSKKPYLILVHGELQSSYTFRNIISKLESNFNILVPDFPGFGKSTKFRKTDLCTYEKMVEWFSAWLRTQVDIEDAIIYAQGLGGQIALRSIADRLHLFKGLILGNTALFDNEHQRLEPSHKELFVSTIHRAEKVSKIIQDLLKRTKPLTTEETQGFDCPFTSEGWKFARQTVMFYPTPDTPQSNKNTEVWKKLKLFKGHVSIISGTKDNELYGPICPMLQKGFEDAHFIEVQDSGMILSEDAPHVLVEEILRMTKLINPSFKSSLSISKTQENLRDQLTQAQEQLRNLDYFSNSPKDVQRDIW